MFDHISLLALIAWVFVAFVEHCIAKAGGLTIIGHLFAKLGADLRPGAETGGFAVAFIVWFLYGWWACWAVVAAMSIQLIVSANLFKFFYKNNFN